MVYYNFEKMCNCAATWTCGTLIGLVIVLFVIFLAQPFTVKKESPHPAFTGSSYIDNTESTYDALITECYDGDTVTANINLFDNMWLLDQHIRLMGIDAPEVTGDDKEKGIASRDFIRKQLMNQKVKVKFVGRDKYGTRILCEIKLLDGTNINELMVNTNHAAVYEL